MASTTRHNTGSADGAKHARWHALDLLRFAAALAVVVYHYAPRFDSVGISIDDVLLEVSQYGYMGVDLFFIISGIVISQSAEGRTARSFLVNRAVRLYPTFWIAVGLTLFIRAWLIPDHSVSVGRLVANLTMLPGYLGQKPLDDVYWTLAVEWKFYALVSVLLAVGLFRHAEPIGRAWVVMIFAQHNLLQSSILASLTIFPYGSHFAFGVLAMYLKREGVTRLRLVWLILATVACVHTTIKTHVGFVSAPTPRSTLVSCILTVAMCCLVVALAIVRVRPAHPAMWASLGALTYPMYLIHSGVFYPMLDTLSKGKSGPFMGASLTIAALALTSYLMATLLESRLVPVLARTAIIVRASGLRRGEKAASDGEAYR